MHIDVMVVGTMEQEIMQLFLQDIVIAGLLYLPSTCSQVIKP